ncbi:hypothetical protein J3998_03090 [Thiomicrorhabdus sp. 6S2-11]|uniref:Uncharacterized protein n=1 Tax=Thiomicrorhabdus marina TaxID=2818442 RepID=A0ABS3Q2K2_9GAMM|nr:hypothetical protein [Thiomicrorhabdus marina]MBO1926550.1 hypothetical protein [Thiomicrorhabdus marina]
MTVLAKQKTAKQIVNDGDHTNHKVLPVNGDLYFLLKADGSIKNIQKTANDPY